MSRYTGPVCKLCRREQVKLFLKGERCLSPKCALDPGRASDTKGACGKKRDFPPGQHGNARQRKMSQYAIQLREKQKLRRTYGVTERVFRTYFARASKQEGITGENFLRILERRLDNVVYRLGFAASRPAARQLVAHGNVCVNGRKVDIPSFLVKKDMEISVNAQMESNVFVAESLERARGRHVPEWLELDATAAKGVVKSLPNRDEISTEVNEQVIVEFYSRMGC